MDKKLRELKLLFESIILKAKKIKDNKKYTDDERNAIIKGIKEEFTDALLSLEYIIETPGYRDPAYEVQESFVLKAKDLDIIKDDKELDEIFVEIYKRKKSKDINVIEEIKKRFKKIILEKPLDLNKLAYILLESTEVEEPGFITEKYMVDKLKELEVFDEVYKIYNEIITRAGEKFKREEERELKTHEARLRTLEREREREEEAKFKKEYGYVSRRAGSYWKTVDAMFPKVAKLPVELESPGLCLKCKKVIKNELYYYEPKSGVLMHSKCAKEEFEKEAYKSKSELEIVEIIKELYK